MPFFESVFESDAWSIPNLLYQGNQLAFGLDLGWIWIGFGFGLDLDLELDWPTGRVRPTARAQPTGPTGAPNPTEAAIKSSFCWIW